MFLLNRQGRGDFSFSRFLAPVTLATLAVATVAVLLFTGCTTTTARRRRFERRRDFRRFADKLTDTGIAGTPIYFRFYSAAAGWLADRWPDKLRIDWDGFDNTDALEPYLPLLGSYGESAALENLSLDQRLYT